MPEEKMRSKAYEIGEKCGFDRNNPEYAAALEEELINLPGFEDWVHDYVTGYRKWLEQQGKDLAETAGEKDQEKEGSKPCQSAS